jgi:hypothetical protein
VPVLADYEEVTHRNAGRLPTIILGLLAPIVIPIAAFGLLYAIVAFVSYWTALGRKKETELPILPPLPPTAEAWERDRAVRLLRKSRTKTVFRGEFVPTLQHCCPVDGGYDFNITLQDKGF